MPKKVFASEEERQAWREKRANYLKEYKKTPKYRQYLKDRRKRPSEKEYLRKYLKKYFKTKKHKDYRKAYSANRRQNDPEYVSRQSEINAAWAKLPEVKEKRNAARRAKRKKEREKLQRKREKMLARMSPEKLKAFLANEGREKREKLKEAARKRRTTWRQKSKKAIAQKKKQETIQKQLHSLVNKNLVVEWRARLELCIKKVLLMRIERAERIKRESSQYISRAADHAHEMKILSAAEVEKVKKNYRQLKIHVKAA